MSRFVGQHAQTALVGDSTECNVVDLPELAKDVACERWIGLQLLKQDPPGSVNISCLWSNFPHPGESLIL